MRFKIPGKPVHVRLFERVQTTDTTYDVVDVGLEYDNPDFDNDTIAVGGSFGSLKRTIKALNDNQAAATV